MHFKGLTENDKMSKCSAESHFKIGHVNEPSLNKMSFQGMPDKNKCFLPIIFHG